MKIPRKNALSLVDGFQGFNNVFTSHSCRNVVLLC